MAILQKYSKLDDDLYVGLGVFSGTASNGGGTGRIQLGAKRLEKNILLTLNKIKKCLESQRKIHVDLLAQIGLALK